MKEIIQQTAFFVKEQLQNAEAGHDWAHTERVWKMAKKIASTEKCDQNVVELAALLHDIADPKFHNGNETAAVKIADEFLSGREVSRDIIDQVLFIIQHQSFKNRKEIPSEIPIELKIVQDADRLDAMGAIGIARAFHFGGFKNNLMYDPEILPKMNMTKEEYTKSAGTTINHFYEKLLLLNDLLHTQKAKNIAEVRHAFMLHFLEQFLKEWNGEI